MSYKSYYFGVKELLGVLVVISKLKYITSSSQKSKSIMRLLIFIPILLLLTLNSCGDSKITEGEVEYDISYPRGEVTGILAAALPKTMSIVFSGTKMKTTISKGKMFETIIISDESDESMTMYLDFDNQQIFCELTKEEVQSLVKSQPAYDVSPTEEKDTLAGMWCQKYEVTSMAHDTMQPGDAWFTNDLAVTKGAWFSSYSNLGGFPVIYDVERYGIMMHATGLNLRKREVKEEEFEVHNDFKKVDFETYENEVQILFDLLMD